MKTIDVRIACSDQFQVFVHDVLLAVEKEYPVTAQITVTELPPPRGEDENKCEWRWDTDGFWHTNCGGSFTLNTGDLKQNEFNYCHKCGRKIYEMYPVEPAAPVAHRIMQCPNHTTCKRTDDGIGAHCDLHAETDACKTGCDGCPPCVPVAPVDKKGCSSCAWMSKDTSGYDYCFCPILCKNLEQWKPGAPAVACQIPFPDCYKNCTTGQHLGVSECESVCPSKFDKDGNPVAPAVISILKCNVCGAKEQAPFDEGDKCVCGGVFKTKFEKQIGYEIHEGTGNPTPDLDERFTARTRRLERAEEVGYMPPCPSCEKLRGENAELKKKIQDMYDDEAGPSL